MTAQILYLNFSARSYLAMERERRAHAAKCAARGDDHGAEMWGRMAEEAHEYAMQRAADASRAFPVFREIRSLQQSMHAAMNSPGDCA